MEKNIRLYLLTGFLGAGKTTFLQRALKGMEGCRIGIIMNEFGNISVDGTILRAQGMEIAEINNGSVFCSCLKGAFIDALVEYSMLPIEALFVESSGMADPSNIESLLDEVIGIAKGKPYDYCGAICIVDAVNFLEQLEVLLPIGRQIMAAGCIIINKADLASPDEMDAVERKIASLNPSASMIRTSHCDIDFKLIMEKLAGKRQKGELPHTDGCCTNTPGNRPAAHIIRLAGVFEDTAFREFLSGILPWTLRIKGFFCLASGWKKVDIAGMHVEIEPLEMERDISELVIITNKGLPALEQIYAEWDKRFEVEMELE